MDSVEFNVWDVGGPASLSTVNQCFFTDKALYVVIWNLALGEEAVASLQSWLLNIEVRTGAHRRSLGGAFPAALSCSVIQWCIVGGRWCADAPCSCAGPLDAPWVPWMPHYM